MPLKVSLLAWRTLNKRILTKDNLTRRGVISSNSMLCSRRCGREEYINHIFVECISLAAFGLQLCVGWGSHVFFSMILACMLYNLVVVICFEKIFEYVFRCYDWRLFGFYGRSVRDTHIFATNVRLLSRSLIRSKLFLGGGSSCINLIIFYIFILAGLICRLLLVMSPCEVVVVFCYSFVLLVMFGSVPIRRTLRLFGTYCF